MWLKKKTRNVATFKPLLIIYIYCHLWASGRSGYSWPDMWYLHRDHSICHWNGFYKISSWNGRYYPQSQLRCHQAEIIYMDKKYSGRKNATLRNSFIDRLCIGRITIHHLYTAGCKKVFYLETELWGKAKLIIL